MLYRLGVPCPDPEPERRRLFRHPPTRPTTCLTASIPKTSTRVVAAWSATLWMIAGFGRRLHAPGRRYAGQIGL
ncbi:MAG: hypothetical protein WDN06_10005 [Asticcacaulis sp.]